MYGGVDYLQGRVTGVSTDSRGLPSSATVELRGGREAGEVELEFGKLVIAAGGDSGEVGGQGRGESSVSCRWAGWWG